MPSVTANLRVTDTDPSNPDSGPIVAVISLPVGEPPNDQPPLLLQARSITGEPRLFVRIRGSFAYSGAIPYEYVEAPATPVDLDEKR